MNRQMEAGNWCLSMRDSFLVSFAVLCLRFSSCLSLSPRSQGMSCLSKALLKFLCFLVFLRGKTLPPPRNLWALPRLSSLFGDSLAPGTMSALTLDGTGSSSPAPLPHPCGPSKDGWGDQGLCFLPQPFPHTDQANHMLVFKSQTQKSPSEPVGTLSSILLLGK